MIRGLFPPSLLSSVIGGATSQISSTAIQRVQLLDSAYAKFLVYGLANNFAGMDGISHADVWEFLRAEAGTQLLPFLRLLPNMLFRAVAEKLFQCAIEAGDAHAVELFLSNPEISLDPNEVVCLDILGRRRTAIEMAAMCRDKEVIHVLLRHKADVNRLLMEREHNGTHGALSLCLGRHRFQPRSANQDPGLQDLVRLFIDAGASVDPSIVNYEAVTCPAVFEMLVEAGTPTNHLKCFGMGIFHKCLKFLTPETAVKVFERVLLSPAVDPTINQDTEFSDSGD